MMASLIDLADYQEYTEDEINGPGAQTLHDCIKIRAEKNIMNFPHWQLFGDEPENEWTNKEFEIKKIINKIREYKPLSKIEIKRIDLYNDKNFSYMTDQGIADEYIEDYYFND